MQCPIQTVGAKHVENNGRIAGCQTKASKFFAKHQTRFQDLILAYPGRPFEAKIIVPKDFAASGQGRSTKD